MDTLVKSQEDLKVILGGGDSTEEGKANPLASALARALATDAQLLAMERFSSKLDPDGLNENGERDREGQAPQ